MPSQPLPAGKGTSPLTEEKQQAAGPQAAGVHRPRCPGSREGGRKGGGGDRSGAAVCNRRAGRQHFYVPTERRGPRGDSPPAGTAARRLHFLHPTPGRPLLCPRAMPRQWAGTAPPDRLVRALRPEQGAALSTPAVGWYPGALGVPGSSK